MKHTPLVRCLTILLLAGASVVGRASMTIQSLSGAVTSTEISSYETFMAGQSPPSAQTYDNNLADGTAGMNCESLGLIYEVTNDPTLLNEMITYADAIISLRNDFTDQRVMWTGNVDPVWLTKASTSSEAGYAGCENNDIVGHVAYCAKLILEHPSLWSQTVPDGNPHGYGATYYQRATNYIAQMEYSEDNYFTKYFINTSTFQIKDSTSVGSAFAALGESTTAWNRQMMFLNGWQRLSECHQILGDNPAKVAEYNSIVQAAMNWFVSQLQPGTAGGQPVYNWTYAPNGSGSEDNTLHSTYDIWGITRAYNAGIYTNIGASTMIPFANTLQYAMNVSTNHISYYVNGTSSPNSPRSFIYPGWMPIANFGPTTYSIMANMNITQGSQGSTAIFDAFILWDKNARFTGFYANNNSAADYFLNSPWIETVNVGGNANYPVTVNSLFGFGSGVTISVNGLPSGVSASVSPGYNATITLTASTSAAPGVYSATVSGTGGGITRTVPIVVDVTNSVAPDFTISASPSSQGVSVTGSTTYTVNIGSLNNFSGSVSLSASGLPTGASASFNPGSVSGSGSSTLTVTTSGSTPAGSYTVTITGTSGSLTHTANVTLSVNDFTVSGTPSSQTVTAGNNTTYTANVGNVNGFTGTVSLSASGLPTGASASFNPTSVTAPGSSTMTVSTTTSTPVGTDSLTVTGTSGSLSHGSTVSLVVNSAADFSISATPSSQTVNAGNSTTYTATISPVNGFNGAVSFSVSGLPSGASAGFSPTSVTGSGSSTLTITTTSSMPASTNTLTITGTSGSLQHGATVTLIVNSTTVTWTEINDTDSGITYSAGWVYSANRNDGDFNNDVHYTKTNGNYAQYTFNGTGVEYITETYSDEGNVDIYIDGTFQTTVNCNSATRAAQVVMYSNTSLSSGSHTIKAVKNGGTYMLLDAFAYTAAAVPNFSVSASPSSQTVTAGNGTSYTATITPVNGFSGTVNLSVSGLPSGASGSFNPTSVTGSGTSTLSVTTATSTAPGTYTLTITGISGTLTNSTTATLVVTAVPDFSIAASPSSASVNPGAGTSYTATVTALNGFSGTVSFSVSGLPTGATGSFNPTSVNGSGSSTLTVSTTTSVAPGSYTLTVTGTSGSLVHSATVTLVVNTPDFSISASPSSQTVTAGNGTSYTATTSALNGFSGSISLTVSGLPSGASGSFNPTSVTGSGSSTLSVTTSTNTPAGTYTLTITGTSGSLQHSATVILTVNAVSQTWTEINDTDSGITYSAGWTYGPSRGLGDFDDDVHYTTTNGNYAQYTFNGTGVEYITETYTDEGNVDIYIDGTFQTTVNCNSATRAAQVVMYSNTSLSAGSHTIKVVKNSGTFMLVDAFAYTTTSTPDFSISATPSSQSVTPGNGTSYTATVSALNGFNSAVSFTVSGLPTGANGTFSPASVTGSGSSTLSVTTSSSTPTGTYTVTVTGTSGSLVHSATVTLVVSSANSNIAPSGTAYGWSGMTSSTANTGKAALPGLNDNNLTVDVDIQPAGDNVNAWEAAGVIWSSTKSISSVDFINGAITSGGDGFLTASLKLQFSTDGSTWTDSGWTVSPAYPYSSSAGGQTYTFSGTAVSGKLGARVIGQVRTTDTSYHWIVKEVQVTGH